AWTHREPPTTSVSRERVFEVVDAAFAHRRKALRGALRTIAPGEAVDAALEQAGIEPLTRGETLTIHDFVRIAEGLAPEVTQ
ncbi:16S rRNA (adenine(1518)-N(6)/adenine(1519)-N(6))-dimethyltransferase, partial [Nocardioides hankookensis]